MVDGKTKLRMVVDLLMEQPISAQTGKRHLKGNNEIFCNVIFLLATAINAQSWWNWGPTNYTYSTEMNGSDEYYSSTSALSIFGDEMIDSTFNIDFSAISKWLGGSIVSGAYQFSDTARLSPIQFDDFVVGNNYTIETDLKSGANGDIQLKIGNFIDTTTTTTSSVMYPHHFTYSAYEAPMPSWAFLTPTGTTWYVSPNGDNANNGTSSSTPVVNLQAVIEDSVSVGDAVLLERGTITLLDSSNYVYIDVDSLYIGDYGDKSLTRPIVDGQDKMKLAIFEHITTTGQISYLTIKNLQLQGMADWTSHAVEQTAVLRFAGVDHLVVDSCLIDGENNAFSVFITGTDDSTSGKNSD